MHIGAAITQCGQCYWKLRQAVMQVFTKPALAHQFFKSRWVAAMMRTSTV